MTAKGIKAIIGNGYDDSMLTDQRHPNRGELDQVSETIPVCIFHQSGHYGVCNTAGLNAAGFYDEPETTNPPGGTIYRDRDNKDKMTGLLGERAFMIMLGKMSPALDDKILHKAEEMYTAQGFTTVQEGRALDKAALRTLSQTEFGKVDVVAYVDL
ncbi:MAG: hypothetical protein QOF89_2633 [Acidobacteriota bacterium]|jgi:predicted amidohydrolase YtcJ|nr:hypothetical protein [Acidobacteriota bacterium]